MNTFRFAGTKILALTLASVLFIGSALVGVQAAGASPAPIDTAPSINALAGIPGGAYMPGMYCFSDSDCVAVGQDTSNKPLVINGDPASWTASGAEEIAITGGGVFNAVTCTSATTCIAVGNTNTGEPLVLSGDPATWGAAQAQVFSYPEGGSLYAITCTSTTWCIAVGNYSTNTGDVIIQLVGDPASWSSSDISAVALSSTFDDGGDLYAITCTAETACVAVGDDNYGQPFSLTGDPASWTTDEGTEITLTDALGTGGSLDAISCSSATQCTAAGSDGNYQPLVVTGDPSSWTATQASETTLGNSFGDSGEINALSCTSATQCSAAGDDGNSQPLVINGDPSSWTSTEATEVTLGASLGSGGEFDGIACFSSTDCVTNGSDGNNAPISIVGSPTAWTASGVVTVALTGASLGAGGGVDSLSCPSPTTCVAVGEDVGDDLLMLHGNPNKWTDAKAEQLGSTFDGELSSISCVTTTSCVAVGQTYGSSSGSFGPSEPVVLHGNPATWTGAQVKAFKLGKPLGSGGELSTVTCTSKTMCIALGTDYTGQPIILQGNPTTWKTVSVKLLKIGKNGDLYDVTCTSATNCVAVGEDSANRLWTVSGNPAKWNKSDTQQITLSTTLGTSGVLTSVSCSSATACVAVGESGRFDPIVLLGNPAKWGAPQVFNIAVPKPTSKTVTGFDVGDGGSVTKGWFLSISCTTAIHCVVAGSDETRAPIVIQGNPAKWRGQSAQRLHVESNFDTAAFGAVTCVGKNCYGSGEATGGVFLTKL